jgi:hypothetical protein
MMTDGGGVQTGIDSAEQHLEARRYYVCNSLSCGFEELLFGWFPGLRQCRLINYSMMNRACCEALCFETRSSTVSCNKYLPGGKPAKGISAP